MAISDDKSKLIGVLNLSVNPIDYKNEDRKTINFQKSIDKNASICFSTELKTLKSYT